MTKEPRSKSQPQLDPFALPPETTIRYTFLVVFALVTVWSIALNYDFITTPYMQRWLAPIVSIQDYGYNTELNLRYFQILSGAPVISAGKPVPRSDLDKMSEVIFLLRSLYLEGIKQICISLIMPLGLLFLAGLLYLFIPHLIKGTRKLHRFNPKQDADFFQQLEELSKLANIPRMPIVEVDQTASLSPQVFGFTSRYILRLGGKPQGMRLLLRQKKDEFAARILHELGHIANHDVQQTYFALSLWVITIFFGLTPPIIFQVSRLMQEGITIGILTNIFRLLALVVIIRIIGNNLIQTREVYADWRAAFWGLGQTLSNILDRHSTQNEPLWRRVILFHPSAFIRLSFLKNATLIFKLKPDVPFITGVLAGLLLDGVYHVMLSLDVILYGLGGTWFYSTVLNLVKASSGVLYQHDILYLKVLNIVSPAVLTAIRTLIFFPIPLLMVGTLGIRVGHIGLANLDRSYHGHNGFFGLLVSSLLVSIGMLFGMAISPGSVFFNALVSFSSITYFVTISFFFFLIINWIWLLLVRALFRQFMGSFTGKVTPRFRLVLGIMLSSFSLCILYAGYLNYSTYRFLSAAASYDNEAYREFVQNTHPSDLPSFLFLLFLSVGFTLFIWIAFKGYTWIRSPRCPSCSRPMRQKYAIGQSCVFCGEILTPWFYTKT